MEKIFFIFLVTLTTVVKAQSAIPKFATDIAPLLKAEKKTQIILKSSKNEDAQLLDLLKVKKEHFSFFTEMIDTNIVI